MALLRTTSMALALCLLAGCGDDDDKGSNTLMDAGTDGGNIDASVKPDAGDSGIFDNPVITACNSFKPAAGTMCGGSHCLETLDQVKAGRAGGACTSETEAAAFCDLSAPNEVRTCALSNLTNAAGRDTCAATALAGKVSAPCLKCFTDSAQCAAEQCFGECASANSEATTLACDTCRIEKGCISSFYACAGFKNPVPL
jgi:hypothetical protein